MCPRGRASVRACMHACVRVRVCASGCGRAMPCGGFARLPAQDCVDNVDVALVLVLDTVVEDLDQEEHEAMVLVAPCGNITAAAAAADLVQGQGQGEGQGQGHGIAMRGPGRMPARRQRGSSAPKTARTAVRAKGCASRRSCGSGVSPVPAQTWQLVSRVPAQMWRVVVRQTCMSRSDVGSANALMYADTFDMIVRKQSYLLVSTREYP